MSATEGITRVAEAPEGIIRLRIVGDSWAHDKDLRRAARTFAAREAHSLVGAGTNVRTSHAGDGYVTTVDFAVVVRRTAGATDTPEQAKLRAKIAKLQAQLDALTPPPAPKAPREVPAFIARAQAVTCHTCRDHGLVRGVGERAGQPYRTADGAQAAKKAGRAVKCPTHTRVAKVA